MSSTNGYCSTDDLTKPHLDEKDLKARVKGKKLRARQLSWDEYIALRKAQGTGELTGSAIDARILALSLVSPSLTEEEAKAWLVNGAMAELDPVIDELLVFSGLRAPPKNEKPEGAPFLA